MLYLNLGHGWTLGGIDEVRGGVTLPVSNTSARLMRKQPSLQRPLFDPQLYLAEVNVQGRTKACARLASYPWFGVPDVEMFDSSMGKRSDWEKALREHVETAWPGKVPADIEAACESAVLFQFEIGCDQVILPAPLISEREDEAETLGRWLDAGIRAADEHDLGLPLLATVALRDSVLNEGVYDVGGLLEAIVDQVSARGSDVDGVYVVVAQTGAPKHPFEMSGAVARAYLTMVAEFHTVGVSQILTNFADLCGLVAMAVGASGFATGAAQAHRGLHVDGYLDKGGGVALPWFYSHGSVGEYLAETDLDAIVQAKALRRVRDETFFSSGLMSALDGGGSAASVPAWVESRSNCTAARSHFIQRMAIEADQLRSLVVEERREAVLEWLETAEANRLFLGSVADVAPGRHPGLRVWRSLLHSL